MSTGSSLYSRLQTDTKVPRTVIRVLWSPDRRELTSAQTRSAGSAACPGGRPSVAAVTGPLAVGTPARQPESAETLKACIVCAVL